MPELSCLKVIYLGKTAEEAFTPFREVNEEDSGESEGGSKGEPVAAESRATVESATVILQKKG